MDYLISDDIEVIGLKVNNDLNGCKGKIVGPPTATKPRYRVRISQNSTSKVVWIKPNNLKRVNVEDHVFSDIERKKKYGPTEGKQCESDQSKLHFAGAFISKQAYLDAAINRGELYASKFQKLSAEDQRDVLLHKKEIFISEDDKLTELAQKYTGSNGAKCDTCQIKFNKRREPDRICPFCAFAVCDNCVCHTSRGKCYCKDSNFGYDYHPKPDKREWYQYGGYLTKAQRVKANELLNIQPTKEMLVLLPFVAGYYEGDEDDNKDE
eukprot:CAMPEP_0202689344 /NCGR_PEP_ID=MMETSP1385-20130828/4633_1 /ASSEMBLY_ACC=CAM_ASM_000861 /TAXON_ID=933848 /ORGANISM="Elphidium margaritaceum" /LENGTH=265 /DNA_ID=CAMNT_0049344465 /DNA_START=26 /DNA_END=823 /DNA_ORIENTATION=+